MSEPTDSLLCVAEVADRCSVAPATVRRWITSGRLPALLVGGSWRVEPDQLAAMIEQGTRGRLSRYAADVEYAVPLEP
jgi:excisionase family DNA binding protein